MAIAPFVEVRDTELKNIREELVIKYPILKYFSYEHLPSRMHKHSRPFSDNAFMMATESLVPGFNNHAELVAGLRKLLEAKDCFIRSMV